MWALRMLDSNPKAPDGFMYGHWKHLGNYDECLRAKAPDTQEGGFTGKYCLTQLALNKTQERSPLESAARSGQFMRWGVCVPSSCTADDAALVAQTTAALLPPPLGPVAVTISTTEDYCYVTGQRYPFGAGFWCFVILLIVLLTVTATATIIGIRPRNKIELSSIPYDWSDAGSWRATIAAFDARASLHQVLSKNHSPGALKCVDGVRAITMLWILIGHRFNDDINTWTSNYVQGSRMYSKPLAMPLVNSYLAVDTFLLLSGTMTYLTCAKGLEKESFSMLRYLAYRYLRLSIPYAVVIFYYATFT
ncbi:hypothetical protein B566_EDAN010885 [Ephemera danica]|nr:hypothetical protein B566_EDAN010885 [Ephemera danica]